jgi:hypothetical protein
MIHPSLAAADPRDQMTHTPARGKHLRFADLAGKRQAEISNLGS